MSLCIFNKLICLNKNSCNWCLTTETYGRFYSPSSDYLNLDFCLISIFCSRPLVVLVIPQIICTFNNFHVYNVDQAILCSKSSTEHGPYPKQFLNWIFSYFVTFVRSGLGSSLTLTMYARVRSTTAKAPRLITNNTMGGLFFTKLFKFSNIAQSNAILKMFFSPWNRDSPKV